MRDIQLTSVSRQARAAVARPQAAFGVVAAQSAVAVLGDVWTLRILRTIFRGKRRYGDFVQAFGVSRAVLTNRLGKLIEHGVLVRDASDGGHPQYRLSESGLDLWSLFLAMWLWEQDWGTAKDPESWAPDLPRGWAWPNRTLSSPKKSKSSIWRCYRWPAKLPTWCPTGIQTRLPNRSKETPR